MTQPAAKVRPKISMEWCCTLGKAQIRSLLLLWTVTRACVLGRLCDGVIQLTLLSRIGQLFPQCVVLFPQKSKNVMTVWEGYLLLGTAS